MYTRQDVKDGAQFLGIATGWWVAISLVVIVVGGFLSIVSWKAHVAVQTVTAGDRVQSSNLDTDNIINKQSFFYQTNQDYVAALARIQLFKKRVAAENASTTDEQKRADNDGLTANQSSCLATAAAYNAQAQNFNSGQFRAISLPSQLSTEACSQ